MNLTVWVDVAIGLTLVYLGASLFVTIISEYIAQFLKLRAKQLSDDLKKLIDNEALILKLAENPALGPFFTTKDAGSSYVDTKVLAQQIIGGVRATVTTAATMQEVIAGINSMCDSKIKRHLLALSQTTSEKVDEFVQAVSNWADSSLTMMGERYKKRTRYIAFCIGLLIAIILNLDTINITKHLYRDKETREAMTLLATDFVQNTSKDSLATCSTLTIEALKADTRCKAVRQLLESVRHQEDDAFSKLPIGWSLPNNLPLLEFVSQFASEFIKRFNLAVCIGWLLTALATSLGASFWFDLLNRVVNIRHGMKRPEVVTTGGKPTS